MNVVAGETQANLARTISSLERKLAPSDILEEVTASSLVKVDESGNPVDPTPFITNPAGFTIHSALHMNCEDAHAVMHLHTPAGQAVSAMEFGLLEHTQTGMIVRNGRGTARCKMPAAA